MKIALVTVIIIALVLGGTSFFLYSQNSKIKTELNALKEAKAVANKKLSVITDILDRMGRMNQGDFKALMEIEKKVDEINDSKIKESWNKVKTGGNGDAFLTFLKSVLESAGTDLK